MEAKQELLWKRGIHCDHLAPAVIPHDRLSDDIQGEDRYVNPNVALVF